MLKAVVIAPGRIVAKEEKRGDQLTANCKVGQQLEFQTAFLR